MPIKNFDQYLEKYAELIITTGINVQPTQSVIIYAEVTQQPLVHALIDSAYQHGAKAVQVEWKDDYITHALIQNASDEVLNQVPTSTTIKAQEIASNRISRISIMSEDPDSFGDLDQQKVAIFSKSQAYGKKPVMDATMNNELAWVVVAAASPAWAKKVFPELNPAEACEKLWLNIFKFNRIESTQDPTVAWQKHIAQLNQHATWLNQENFKALHYLSPRTDITVGLAENHHWEGADSNDKAGNYFTANLPTEEVFTSPDYRHIDGHVTATKPLSYGGVLINDIQLTFENGVVTKATASTGQAVLDQLLASDSGAKSLGEVALVPNPSPISQSGLIFYNTLIDENASNHMALGAAYPFNINNGTQMDDATRQAHGQNQSIIHVDFMMGSADLDIDGIKADGSTVPVFRQGDWAK